MMHFRAFLYTIILRGGDVVPADVKIMECNNLSVNESQLTGESVPVSKGCDSTDVYSTLIFSGSVIERGKCQCVVYATGNETELGKIAMMSKNTKKVTPYQKSLTEFSLSILRMIAATMVLMLAAKIITIHSANALTRTNLFLFYNFTQLLVVIAVRSKGFFWKGSKPSPLLLGTIVFFMAFSVALTYIPFTANIMGFTKLPLINFATLAISTIVFFFLLDMSKVALNKWKENELSIIQTSPQYNK